jgi:hypothetical protein
MGHWATVNRSKLASSTGGSRKQWGVPSRTAESGCPFFIPAGNRLQPSADRGSSYLPRPQSQCYGETFCEYCAEPWSDARLRPKPPLEANGKPGSSQAPRIRVPFAKPFHDRKLNRSFEFPVRHTFEQSNLRAWLPRVADQFSNFSPIFQDLAQSQPNPTRKSSQGAGAISTRRFRALPSTVLLSATGRFAPNPWGTSRAPSTPRAVSQETTAAARASESGRLRSASP